MQRASPLEIRRSPHLENQKTSLRIYGEPKNNSVGELQNHVLYIFHVFRVLQTNSMLFKPTDQRSVLKGTMNCSQPELGVGDKSKIFDNNNCSSQPSMVHCLSSSIFPFVCLFVCPAMVTSDQISLLVAPHPQTHTFSESL